MFLSREQMGAVNHGRDGLSWEMVERPSGPVEIPAWAKDAHVDWSDGYVNPPSFRLKTHGNVRDWPDQRFVKEGRYYRAYHEDGRLEQYAHSGAVSLRPIKMFRSENGTHRQHRRCGPEWADESGLGFTLDGVRHGYEPGEWAEVEMLATTQQEGFGGSHYHCQMVDGTTIVVRGPWHTSPPAGYDEVAYVDTSNDRNLRRAPWHQRGGIGGLFLRDSVLIAIASRFLPHLQLARVTGRYGTNVEPLKPEWDAPKAVIIERERVARRAVMA